MCSVCVETWYKSSLQMLVQCWTGTVHRHITNKQQRSHFCPWDGNHWTYSEELFPHKPLKTLQAVQEQQVNSCTAFIVQMRFTGFLPAMHHCSLCLCVFYWMLRGELITSTEWHFRGLASLTEPVALHRIKTKTDIYNNIPGILCCLYKFP